MWNKWLFKDLQKLHLFQKPHGRETRRLAGRGQAAAQENDTNDMSGASSASEMNEDCGET